MIDSNIVPQTAADDSQECKAVWAECTPGGIAAQGLQAARDAIEFKIDRTTMRAAWKKLGNRKPKLPTLLLRRLDAFLAYPRDAMLAPVGAELHAAGKSTDALYDNFAQAGRALAAHLTAIAPSRFVLAEIMAARVPSNERYDLARKLDSIEPRLTSIVSLPKRPAADVRAVKGSLARHIVAIIACHVIVDEGRKFRCTFAKEPTYPKGLDARLCAATLHALGVECDSKTLQTHMNEVRKVLTNPASCPDWYTMVMFWPPRPVRQMHVRLRRPSMCGPRCRAAASASP